MPVLNGREVVTGTDATRMITGSHGIGKDQHVFLKENKIEIVDTMSQGKRVCVLVYKDDVEAVAALPKWVKRRAVLDMKREKNFAKRMAPKVVPTPAERAEHDDKYEFIEARLISLDAKLDRIVAIMQQYV